MNDLPLSSPAASRIRRRLNARLEAPKLPQEALHGLAGEIVTELEPLTEASPSAMLVTILSAFGAQVGRTAHFTIGSSPHYANIFTLVVGATGRARKGTSKQAIMPILRSAGNDVATFLSQRLIRGIGSGEALVETAACGGSTSGANGGQPHSDQRLWIIEEEFARLLAVSSRAGSTLSSILRTAWDGEPLENRVRRQTLRAEHAHVGILAHITQHDLIEHLTNVEISNGAANRFLYVFSERTKLLPNPGTLSHNQIATFGGRFGQALSTARRRGEMRFTPEFDNAWAPLYEELEGQAGGEIYDALTARGAAHVKRLALIYALLDGAGAIDAPHLRAAAGLWEFCEATIAHIWRMSSGDLKADKLIDALHMAGPQGMTRAEVDALFSKNLTGDAISALSEDLVRRGLATQTTRASAGRPATVLTAA
jgi:hypothetical protein